MDDVSISLTRFELIELRILLDADLRQSTIALAGIDDARYLSQSTVNSLKKSYSERSALLEKLNNALIK